MVSRAGMSACLVSWVTTSALSNTLKASARTPLAVVFTRQASVHGVPISFQRGTTQAVQGAHASTPGHSVVCLTAPCIAPAKE